MNIKNNNRLIILCTGIVLLAELFMIYLDKAMILLISLLIILFLTLFFYSRKFSLLVLLASIVMDKISITIGGITITIGMVIVILTFIKFMLNGSIFSLKIVKGGNLNKIIISCFILITLLVTSSLFAVDKVGALSKTIQFIFLMGTAFIIYIYTKEFEVRYILKCIIITGSLNIILGILQFLGYYLGFNINSIFSLFDKLNGRAYYGISVVNIGGTIVPRMNGFFVDPAPFAGFVTTLICIIFCMNLYKMNFKNIITLAICSVSVLLSFSRSAWLGTGVTLILLIIFINFNRKYKSFKINLSIVILITLLILLFKDRIYFIVERILQTFQIGDVSSDGHKSMAVYAIKAFISNPIIGIGLNNFKDFVGYNTMTHSMYLTFLSETGILGSLAYFYIWFNIMRKLYIKRNYSNEIVCIFFILLSILISNIGYDYYNQLYIWSYIGIAIGLIDKEENLSVEAKM
ncbi:MAG: O-antigen ligase family protein [Clostridium sp.]|nr:O-antigen ligase family protein [Clostridium sp.]